MGQFDFFFSQRKICAAHVERVNICTQINSQSSSKATLSEKKLEE
jgi:hypothetical protein